MTPRVLGALVVATVVAGGVTACGSPSGGDGQAPAFRASRLPGTEHPDFNGIWQAMTTANWDILDHGADAGSLTKLGGAWAVQPEGRGIVEGNEIPYKEEARARQRTNLQNRLKFDPQNPHDMGDPEAKCYMAGVPRAMYMPYPIQILQTDEQILMAFEYASAGRTIHLKDHREAPVPSWMGWSNGRWEGETLVVEVTSQNGNSWLDRVGNYATDTLKVTERYTLRDADHLMYEATLEDPAVFTRPFKISFPLYRRIEANTDLGEMKCVEFVEDYLYGSLKKKSK